MIKAGLGGAKARRRGRLAVLRGKTSAAIGPGVGSADLPSKRRRPAAPERSEGAKGLRSPRRETPKVAPGAAEETEGFRGLRSKTRRGFGIEPRKPKACEAAKQDKGRRRRAKGAGRRRKTKVKLRGRGLTKHCRL